MEFTMEADRFNLDLSFKPSFVSSMYHRVKLGRWVKITGHLGRMLQLDQPEPSILRVKSEAGLTREALERRAMLETGLWRGPYEDKIGVLPSSIKPQVEALSNAYLGVRLPIAPLDFNHILIAIGLSKRADYDRFVLDWCRKIWRKYDGDIYRLSEAAPYELKLIGSSYQILQLQRTLKSFIELVEHLPENVVKLFGAPTGPSQEYVLMLPPQLARMVLIDGCWGLGPKTVDSIIISTSKATDFIPCDIHLQSTAVRLGFVEAEGLRMPNKALCSRFLCSDEESKSYGIPVCPWSKNNVCLRKRLAYFGILGGWIQTLTYLHGRTYCRTLNPKCDVCPISTTCPKIT